MNISRQENATLIKHLETIEREIKIEGNDQRATISVVHVRYIPLIIEKLRKLDQYEKEELKRGKESARAYKEANHTAIQLHEPGCPDVHVWAILD